MHSLAMTYNCCQFDLCLVFFKSVITLPNSSYRVMILENNKSHTTMQTECYTTKPWDILWPNATGLLSTSGPTYR